MSIGRDKLVEVLKSCKHIGDEKTIKKYNIKEDTLRRYKAEFRLRNIKLDFNYCETKIPKILLLDIEILPMHALIWGTYKQRIPISNIELDWCVLSYVAKWLNQSEYYHDILTSEECRFRYNNQNPKKERNEVDKRVCASLYKLMDEADIIVGHNLNRYDHRKMTARFIEFGFGPLSPLQTIDTLMQSRKLSMFSSHKLDYLGQLLRNKGKIETNYQLWKDCMVGNEDALGRMLEYNIEDVALLEEVYLWLRGYMKSHPNLGLYYDLEEPICPNCGGEIEETDKFYYTTANKFRACRCRKCGAYSRLRTSDISKDNKRHLLSALAR